MCKLSKSEISAAAMVGLLLSLFSLSMSGQTCTSDSATVVNKAYEVLLNRQAISDGQNWYATLTSTNSVRALLIGIAKSIEWRGKHGNYSQPENIAALYRLFLHREPDPGAVENWMGVSDKGGWEAVVDGIALNPEALSHHEDDTTIPGTDVTWCRPQPCCGYHPVLDKQQPPGKVINPHGPVWIEAGGLCNGVGQTQILHNVKDTTVTVNMNVQLNERPDGVRTVTLGPRSTTNLGCSLQERATNWGWFITNVR